MNEYKVRHNDNPNIEYNVKAEYFDIKENAIIFYIGMNIKAAYSIKKFNVIKTS